MCPIFPQPPGIGKKISGASSTNAACCSSVSIRFPYPSACEASEANFLPASYTKSWQSCVGVLFQSLRAMSGSTFHLNHREWNSLFRQTAERHGKLTGYVSSHDKYRHPIFQRRAGQMLGSTAGLSGVSRCCLVPSLFVSDTLRETC